MKEKTTLFNFSTLNQGDCAVVRGFFEGSAAYRKKLLAMGVTIGTAFKVVRVAPFGDPVEINLRGYMLSLRKEEAGLISVEKVS